MTNNNLLKISHISTTFSHCLRVQKRYFSLLVSHKKLCVYGSNNKTFKKYTYILC